MNGNKSVVLFLYEPDRRCEIMKALAYAEVATRNMARRVLVYEGDYLAFDMRRKDRREMWGNVARKACDAV